MNLKEWRMLHWLCCLAWLVVGTYLAGQTYEIKVRGNEVGKTPEVLGYTLGHLIEGSNSFDWLRYTEVNGFRVWSSPPVIEAEDDIAPWGDGVDSYESLTERRARLRKDPLNPEYINWEVFERGFDSETVSANRMRMRVVMEHAKSAGYTPLIMIHRGVGSYPFDDASGTDWASRWECWQHFYAQAFWYGRHYSVERFQVYNEPDHSSNAKLSQAEYIERLRISSDAIQCALADVNRLYGKSLEAQVTAPVTTSAMTKFHARPDREKDRRDAEKGWGELVMEERLNPYFSDAGEDFANFNVYAYQQYGRNGPSFADQYRGLRNLVADANEGEPLPVWITEFNCLANYMFRRTEDTMHTPKRAMRLGSILLNLMYEQPDELYVFKFGQTTQSVTGGRVAKNGTYWQDNDTGLRQTTGSTRGGEVYRLIMRTFQRGRDQLTPPTWVGSEPEKTWVGGSHDNETGAYHLFVVTEEDKDSVALRFDLRDLDIALPSVAILEEVSMVRHGSVRALVQIPPTGKLDLELSPETAWHIEIPKQAPGFATIPAAGDATVRGGKHVDRNYGTEKKLIVHGDRFAADKRQAAYLKFDTEQLPMHLANKVLLRLNLKSTVSNEVVPAHVYGLPGTAWEEASLTGATAPSLEIDGPPIREMGDNLVRGQGTDCFILGTITGTREAEDQFVDITKFVREHPKGFSILITQEYRFTGDLEQRGQVEIASRESGATGPSMLIFYDVPAKAP
jgi:hypothetical protein